MQFNRVSNIVFSIGLIFVCTRIPCAPGLRNFGSHHSDTVAFTVNVVLHGTTSSSIPPLYPPSFHCQFSDRCLSPLLCWRLMACLQDFPAMRAVFINCKSWLPIVVQAPGYLRTSFSDSVVNDY